MANKLHILLFFITLSLSFCIQTQAAGEVEHRALVIAVQFDDLPMSGGINDITNISQKASQYFQEQTGKEGDFEFTVYDKIVSLPRKFGFYGENNPSTGVDSRTGVLVIDVCKAIDGDIDFSAFDSSGNNEVDCVAIVFAGGSESNGAGEDHLWSQQSTLSKAARDEQSLYSLVLDGKKIETFILIAEMKLDGGPDDSIAGIGAFCHEYGHVLGFVDLYDHDGVRSGGEMVNAWKRTDLMNQGNFNDNSNTPPPLSAIELDILGIGQCDELSIGRHTLKPVGEERRYLKLETDCPEEYFLLECRGGKGRDSYIGGKGLLIYHIDKSARASGISYTSLDNTVTAEWRWQSNEVNCNPDYLCAELVYAIPDAVDESGIFFPNIGKQSFGPNTEPPLRFHSGETPNLQIKNIRINADGSASFDVTRDELSIEVIFSYENAATVIWSSVLGGRCDISLDGKKVAEGIFPFEDNHYSCTIEGLEPGCDYEIIISDKECERKGSFTTKPHYSGVPLFINLSYTPRNSDGSFPPGAGIPLRVTGATEGVSVTWKFNGTKIQRGTDGFYHITENGTLRAEVISKDGRTTIIEKEIRTNE